TPTPHLYSFFFSSYRPPRDLHSFPTRRSSDLHCGNHCDPNRKPRDGIFRGAYIRDPQLEWRGTNNTRSVFRWILNEWWRKPRQRSEEHTSELQSRSDLVCRLLLEKKKKKKKKE